jgi:tRNA threonylcarbamoyladenosine biosynthesis protein TsaB
LNLLAFDTSTEHLSVALAWLQDGAPRLAAHAGPGGAAASATLLPTVQRLLAEAGLRPGDLAAVVFGQGPGSFTGLRTACSVAQGLAWGAGVPVLPVATLLAVAEEARYQTGTTRVMAVLDARMDEVYAAGYAWDGRAWAGQAPPRLLKPEAVGLEPGWVLAGNAHRAYPGRLAGADMAIDALPTAAALLRLAPGLLAGGHGRPAAEALPLYIRDKVADTTAERAARAAQQSVTGGQG